MPDYSLINRTDLGCGSASFREAVIGVAATNSPFVPIVLVRYLRREGPLSKISIEDSGSALGWELPLDAIYTNGSNAQIAYFAKSHERLTADVGDSIYRCTAV